MDSGIISSRYARALLKLVDETGRGEAVYAQAVAILSDPDSVPAALEPELQQFMELLVRNGRVGYVRQMLVTFTRMYNSSRGRRLAHLVTAVPSQEMERKIKDVLEKKLHSEVIISSETDPSIEGGFLLTVDDWRLDASVKGQLERIRRQFMDKNKRIV